MASAIGCPEDDAVRILNLLDEVGLTGAKLACSMGDEEALAAQVTGRPGIACEPWHVVFITAQVRAAVQMEDLQRRVGGSAATSSIQTLKDAAEYTADKTEPLQVIVPKEGCLGEGAYRQIDHGGGGAGQGVEGIGGWARGCRSTNLGGPWQNCESCESRGGFNEKVSGLYGKEISRKLATLLEVGRAYKWFAGPAVVFPVCKPPWRVCLWAGGKGCRWQHGGKPPMESCPVIWEGHRKTSSQAGQQRDGLERCNCERAPLHYTIGIVCQEANPSMEGVLQPATLEESRTRESPNVPASRRMGIALPTPWRVIWCASGTTPLVERCREKKCKFKHVCGICFSNKHPLYECTAKKRQEQSKQDTQGTAWKILWVIELDIQRDRKSDFTLPSVQKRWLQRVAAGEFFCGGGNTPVFHLHKGSMGKWRGPLPAEISYVFEGVPLERTGS